MDHLDVGRLWNGNADTWTRLARRGYDKCRDLFNTPAFLEMLPDVRGLRGLDLGCGEGGNTRQVARRGASMCAVDIAQRFVGHAREHEQQEPLGIEYHIASAVELPFADESFDFCTAFMSLMDLPEQEQALAEAYRVLKPGGFLQFSITHPCFQTKAWEWVLDDAGRRVAMKCADYFDPPWGDVEEWTFSDAPAEERADLPLFKVPRFNRTLSSWLNLLLDTGFALERVCEPHPDAETVRAHPRIYSARVIAFFLTLRGRKPGVRPPV